MDLWVKNLLRKKLDLEKFQRPSVTMDQALQILEQSRKSKELIIVGSESNYCTIKTY